MFNNSPPSSLPPTTLPPVSEFPIDGYGGSYYYVQFPVPVYDGGDPGLYTTISWSDIDTFYSFNTANALESAVSFGICAVTLLNIVVLTPQHKRKLPLHSCICLALLFQTIRNAADLVLVTRSLWVSSYVYLTIDVQASSFSKSLYALSGIDEVAACLAFVFVQACFFIQARALTSWLRAYRRFLFYLILTYLTLAGIVAIGFRIGLAAVQIIYLTTTEQLSIFKILHTGTLITYGVSIGSWSMVFFISAISILVNRRGVLLSRNSIYSTALNLIAIIGLQSFVVPILFCILQLLPVHFIINKPEQLIIPSVLFLLPIGTLFTTVQSTNTDLQVQPAYVAKSSACTPKESPGLTIDTDPTSTTDTIRSLSTASKPLLPSAITGGPKKFADPFEIELAAIDGLTEHEEVEMMRSTKEQGEGANSRCAVSNSVVHGQTS